VPFDRLGAENSDVDGTGVGLALSTSLMDRMGGRLDVISSPGRGSTFAMELPRAAALSVLDPVETDRPDLVHSAGAPLVVLYIEDNLSNMRLVERVLARWYDVTLISAMQGSIGLELAARHRPDLVLLDLHLPDMNGADVLTELRRDPDLAHTPVVVLSADATSTQMDRLRLLGVDNYLTKPIELDQLLAVIEVARPNP